ncbi:hypothetical protein Desaci_2609 [Desulfosporosinus acidiphilus SJ4]|uniref:Tetratricopeptide repeat protein n=1 Tax=Desulfosporosinus acidiphilus (strain DSM 22704 / JCM 16185 / SJ4) TaxID=646529 RepID=I4D6W8_DESAJ|nr:DUF6483 family protein [Desulfosporosinus acidiphilus]AFM41542.1 hypothetical protein Desaci_2609 [Desulfosporosinus acidiphilus SJ4]
MFEEKDYLMKMIKEFTNAIAKIAGLKAENKIEESQEVLSETLKHFTDLDMKVIEALPYDILIHKIGGNTVNSEKYLMLSELLVQQAEIYEIRGEKSRANNLLAKSLNIMLNILLNDNNPISESNVVKVNEVVDKLGWYNLPNESELLLFQYYESTQSYAKAEDVLFHLLKSDENNKDILKKGISFYERLKDKDHDELEKGNLPFDEVLEGLESLRHYNG